MHARMYQPGVVAKLGQRALAGLGFAALLDEAVALVAHTLDVEYCKVLELLPDGQALVLRAGVGWQAGLVGSTTVEAGSASQAGYTLLTSAPVIVEELRTETRFSGPPLLHEHGVVSGMSVIIPGMPRPFGVLGAHTTRRRVFTQDAVHFLQATANILAQAIENARLFEELEARERELVAANGALQDEIAERKQAEEALRETTRRLQTLSRRELEIQETERRAVARELHDEIGQALTAIKINLQALERLPDAIPLGLRLEDSIAIAEQTIQQVRDLALTLRPALLDDLGLVPALRWYVDRQAQRAGFTAHFVAEPVAARLPAEIETVCFRVVQEALTNVIRYAQARQVHVELRPCGRELHLCVRDDGLGFDVPAARQCHAHGGSLGLLGMQERVESVGGQLEILSAPTRGTEVRAQIPL